MSNRLVLSFGRLNPPTVGHLKLIDKVKSTAKAKGADAIIWVSKTQDSRKNPLSAQDKVKFLKSAVSSVNIVAANNRVRTFIEAVKEADGKYDELIVVAGSDRVQEFQKLLNKYNGRDYNFDSIEVVSAGARDPDQEGTSGISASKMREFAVKGDYESFKKYSIPAPESKIKDMYEKVRAALLNEEVGVGSVVVSEGIKYEILADKNTYLQAISESGEFKRLFPESCEVVQEEMTFNEGTYKGVNSSMPLMFIEAFEEYGDPLTTLKLLEWFENSLEDDAADNILERLEQLEVSDVLQETALAYKVSYDKDLVATALCSAYNVVSEGSPAERINKLIESVDISSLAPIVELADSVGILYNQDLLPESLRVDVGHWEDLIKEEIESEELIESEEDSLLRYPELTDEEYESYLENLELEDIADLYDDDELCWVDEETGEEFPIIEEEFFDNLDERVMSRVERRKASMRMRRKKGKRQRKLKMALKRRSNAKTKNKRSRRHAVAAMKKRIMKGKKLSKMTTAEKERVERMVAKRKNVVNRLAVRAQRKVRKIENQRMKR